MPLKTTVKVSHLSNLSDARYCAGMGVEMLGFRVIPGEEDYIPPNTYQDIRGWIAGPKIVAELYGISESGQIDTVMQAYAPDYFELTYVEYKAFSHILPLPCMVYFPDSAAGMPVDQGENISHFLVDEHTSCKDITAAGYPVLVKISGLQNLHNKLAEGCFTGIVLEGPKAVRPGVTNYEQLGGILEALEDER